MAGFAGASALKLKMDRDLDEFEGGSDGTSLIQYTASDCSKTQSDEYLSLAEKQEWFMKAFDKMSRACCEDYCSVVVKQENPPNFYNVCYSSCARKKDGGDNQCSRIGSKGKR